MPNMQSHDTVVEELLRKAAEAHHRFEEVNGPDADWPKWYARFIVDVPEYRELLILATKIPYHESEDV